jgi:hypothetical protein
MPAVTFFFSSFLSMFSFYCGTSISTIGDPSQVVRGGIFGGTPGYIDVFAQVYNLLMSQTLSDGYMGTEENLLGALIYRRVIRIVK